MIRRKTAKANRTRRRIVPSLPLADVGTVLLFIFLIPYVATFLFGSGVSGAEARGEEYGEEDGRLAEVLVKNTSPAGVETIPLEEYLTRRLCDTIPSSFEPEALKAQAILLRTQVMRQYFSRKKDGEIQVETEGSLRALHGEEYDKSREAVYGTRGMYVSYEGKPAAVSYFAVSAGNTRSALEALESRDYPYLSSVTCDRDFLSPDYSSRASYSLEIFRRQISLIFPGEVIGEGVISRMTMTQDSAGYVTEVRVGESAVSGERFREVFGLSSSCFALEESQGQVKIAVKGAGHGLGMSQFYANEMAKEGKDFIEILKFFFQGIEIEKS